MASKVFDLGWKKRKDGKECKGKTERKGRMAR